MTTGQEVLSSPTCEGCGYVVPNLVPVGAGCPKCQKRFGVSASSGLPASEHARLVEIIQSQEQAILKLEHQVAELEAKAAAAAGGAS